VPRSPVGLRSCLFALLAFAEAARGAEVIEDRNVWLHFSVTGPLLGSRPGPNPWRFSFDSPHRFAADAREYAQGVWRFAVGRTLSPEWSAWAGYGFTRTDAPYTRTPYFEHRPFQQLLWSRRTPRAQLSYRLRLEERLPEPSHDTGWRVRQQIRVSLPVREIKPLAWVFSEEYFLNLNATDTGARRGLDQNRVFAGASWQWSEVFRSELGYMHHYTRRNGQPNRVNHVLALNLALAFQ
jgi:hypothetical protein